MQATQQKITTIDELERVHLRFIKVNDNKRLTDILSKILSSMLLVYLEADMDNVGPADLEGGHAKVKALEDIMNHLTSKVKNSQGAVMPPVVNLLRIFSSPIFT
jgi:hypothetical protein